MDRLFQIDVAVCAFRRPKIAETLATIAAQALPPDARLRVLVAENDDAPTLRSTIEARAAQLGLDLAYRHAPGRNISIARNACLEMARGDVLLFIDDDELAAPDWVTGMVAAWRETGAGVVFGPAYAVYPPNAPDWMRDNDFHSNIPTRNGATVETGYSSNVLLDLADPRVRDARFDPSFGRTGGEDVDFFFRLHRDGVLMAITEDAVVREPVVPERMSLRWLLRRRHTVGAIYGSCAAGGAQGARVGLALRGGAKALYCAARALAAAPRRRRAAFWLMRGTFHLGVIAGCIAPPRREAYGSTP